MIAYKSNTRSFLKIDPRSKLYFLLIGNLALLVSPSLFYEIILVVLVMIYGILSGTARFSLKMTTLYSAFCALFWFSAHCMSGTAQLAVITFTVLARKMFPCFMMGGILIFSTKIDEFMVALNRLHWPQKVIIPLTVLLRYLPMIGEDWRYIDDAMRMRDVSPSLKSFASKPAMTIECIYVPLLMSASKVADELSAAAIVRGIENPAPRSCLIAIKMSAVDVICLIIITAYFTCAFFV